MGQNSDMKHFPFTITLLCMLVPPFLYIFSVQLLERFLEEKYTHGLENVYTLGSTDLLEGRVRLEDAIQRNIHVYLKKQILLRWGGKALVTVTTKGGTLLYPRGYESEPMGLNEANQFEIARENYKLLTEGLNLSVEVQLEHNRLLTNLILVVYLLLAASVLQHFYRAGLKKTRQEELETVNMIAGLSRKEQQLTRSLENLKKERHQLTSSLVKLQSELEKEKVKASNTEDEMIEELSILEEKLQENLDQQRDQQDEITQLKEQIDAFDREKQQLDKQKVRLADNLAKRFSTLYKHLSIHERALRGYLDLPEEMKIKAEELIHQLDRDSQKVIVKRKVFGKKNRETVFETKFAYKGRLYFRKIHQNRIEVLSVGTKHTQHKDLVFLDNL